MVNLRDPAVVRDLFQKFRVRTTTVERDPAAKGVIPEGHAHEAYKVASHRVVFVKQRELLYFPEYPEDFQDHPKLLGALKVAVYESSDGRRVWARWLRLNAQFFIVSPRAVELLLSGKKSEDELLDFLESQRGVAKGEGSG